jgi:hypothetical protein
MITEFIVIRPKTSFRRGLGAASFTPTYSGISPILSASGSPIKTAVMPSPLPAPVSQLNVQPIFRLPISGPMPDYRLAFSGAALPGTQPAGSSGSSQTASAATMAAFNAALASAVSFGVITPQGAAALQAQAAGASDAIVRSLTAQISQQMASTPSAASVAAGGSAASSAAASSEAPASWWDASTTIFGKSISNPILVIGAGLAAVGIWAAAKKK